MEEKCTVKGCDETFSSKIMLEEHISIMHPEESKKMEEIEKMKQEEPIEENKVPEVVSEKPVLVVDDIVEEPKAAEWDNVLIYVQIKKGTGKLGRILSQADTDEDVRIKKTATLPANDTRIADLIDAESGMSEDKKYY